MLIQEYNDKIVYRGEHRNAWIKRIIETYKKYLELKVLKSQFSEHPIIVEEPNISEEDADEEQFEIIPKNSKDSFAIIKSFNQTIDEILKENVPIDEKFILKAIKKPRTLDPYIPLMFHEPSKPEEVHECDEWVQEYLNGIHEIEFFTELTDQLVLSIIVDAINAAVARKVSKYPKGANVAGGWILVNCRKGSLIRALCDMGYVPEEVLSLKGEDMSFLLNVYKRKKFHPYLFMKEFLLLNGYSDAAEKCPVMEYPKAAVEALVGEILDEILANDAFMYVDMRIAMESDDEGLCCFVSCKEKGQSIES